MGYVCIHACICPNVHSISEICNALTWKWSNDWSEDTIMPLMYAQRRRWRPGNETGDEHKRRLTMRQNRSKTQKIISRWSHVQSQGKLFGHAQVQRKPALSGDSPWAPWNTKKGEVWVMMGHGYMCGACADGIWNDWGRGSAYRAWS